jgi:hypothetical protein
MRKLKKLAVPVAETPVESVAVVESGKVRAIALGHIGEVIDGVSKHFAPGEEMVIDEDRALALGPLIKLIP